MREQKSGKVVVGKSDGEERAQVSSYILVPNTREMEGLRARWGPLSEDEKKPGSVFITFPNWEQSQCPSTRGQTAV